MKRFVLWLWLVGTILVGQGAELKFDLGEVPVGRLPAGFRPAMLGAGATGQWQVIHEAVPSTFQSSLAENISSVKPVIGQMSRDPADTRYCLLFYDREVFDNFTFATRFKIVEGREEQMAGVVFRARDERNFYYFRANAKDGNLKFFKCVNGDLLPPVEAALPVTKGVWHGLKVDCLDNRIRCYYDDQLIFGELVDTTYLKGKLGLATKSDSVSYFSDLSVIYTPREGLAASLIKAAMKEYPRLKGLRVYALVREKAEVCVVGATDPQELGLVAGKEEKDVLVRGAIYNLKDKDQNHISVYLPLRDRNGDIAGVVRVTLETFLGQTERSAVVRAQSVVKVMEEQLATSSETLH